MVGLFLVAGVVTLVAIPPGLALGRRGRMLARQRVPGAAAAVGEGGDRASDDTDTEDAEPSLAL